MSVNVWNNNNLTKVSGAVAINIDDTTASSITAYSSDKVEEIKSDLQDKIDAKDLTDYYTKAEADEKYALTTHNHDTGYVNNQIKAAKSTTGLVTNGQYFKIDITKKSAWYGSLKFTYMAGTATGAANYGNYGEVTLTIVNNNVYYSVGGYNLVSAVKYEVNTSGSNANIIINIGLSCKVYGTHIVEMPTEFATLNSFVAIDSITATTAATRTNQNKITTIDLYANSNAKGFLEGSTMTYVIKNGVCYVSIIAKINTVGSFIGLPVSPIQVYAVGGYNDLTSEYPSIIATMPANNPTINITGNGASQELRYLNFSYPMITE